MIVVTGAAGFIGSCMIAKLNSEFFNDIIAVDDFSNKNKQRNLDGKRIRETVNRTEFFEWLDENQTETEFIIHLGAKTDTTIPEYEIFQQLNVDYSKKIWEKCIGYQVPLIYASSAATYGNGELGYIDSETLPDRLEPLNSYGRSKNEFDKWALSQKESPFFWAGLKFFNVYGPNEYHKGRMASVIFHAYNQIQNNGNLKLFKSHNPDYKDGEQMRDFIYVKDLTEVIFWLMNHRKNSGLYNLGTGQARTFLDLAKSVFHSMERTESIEFIDTPGDIRDNYQYFTEAKMDKLRSIGYQEAFSKLEEGISDYVENYLARGNYY